MPYYCYTDEHKTYLEVTAARIHGAIYESVADLTAQVWVTPEPVSFDHRKTGRYMLATVGMRWGRLWECAWFHIKGKIPKVARARCLVVRVDIDGEGCVVDRNGCALHGLTPFRSRCVPSLGNPGKCVVNAADAAVGNNVDFWVEGGCNDLFGGDGGGVVREMCVAIRNDQMHALFYDFSVLLELLSVLSVDRGRYHTVLDVLTRAAFELRDFTEDEAVRARRILTPELAKRGGNPPSFTISALGHAHLDLAWCWPVRETVRKGIRTFSTALALMKRYPDYRFCASQPQLYDWVKQQQPGLFEGIRKAVADGRWEPVGGMWVEADVNLSGGESIVRQFLYGKRFFRREFSHDTRICFLPDSFGFPACLPQIAAKAGMEYFLTQKIVDQKYFKYPHGTFHWEGIDGTRILAHVPPLEHYSSSAAPASIATYERRFQDKMVCPSTLLLFGQGDGGGGSGEEHLEALAREKDLDGLPPVIQETAQEFFDRIAGHADRYVTWSGALDLDRHTGTFTSQARTKAMNRAMENALRELEFVAVLANGRSGYEYPDAELADIWKEVMLYQFHDVLPGTSITRVHDECYARYEVLLAATEDLTRKADAALFAGTPTGEAREPVAVVNSLAWERGEWMLVGSRWRRIEVPPMGYTVVDASLGPDVCGEGLRAAEGIIENGEILVRFERDGSIASVFDKANDREVLCPGTFGNRLAVYHDRLDLMTPDDPSRWGVENAWDFPIHYDERAPGHFQLVLAKSRIDGPRAVMHQVFKYGGSRLTQDVILTAASRRIDFVTDVDWHESQKMLRTSFAADVRADAAVCGIQFGSVRRNTHRNTVTDFVKVESCAHKWVDLSEGDYGLALLTVAKYGHRLFGNVIDLNLLRSSGFPDPTSDQLVHRFTYSILPHSGDHVDAGVVRAAYELNMPLRVVGLESCKEVATCPPPSFLSVTDPNVVVETVKKAEDSPDAIVRLYESAGRCVKVALQYSLPVSSATLVDLLEENPVPIDGCDGRVELRFRPFEIQTLRLSLVQSPAGRPTKRGRRPK
ncbi:MAG: glycoside hydrolase family 38 C-terminal domain-containing protein [bacterium]